MNDEEFELLVEARSLCADIVADYEFKHGVESTHLVESWERRGCREQIKREIYGNGASRKEKRIDIVMGLPGAGKSSKVVSPLSIKHGSIVLDSDEVKSRLPGYNDGLGAGLVHEESSKLIKDVLANALVNNDNIVYPMVGSNFDSLADLIQFCQELNYHVALHFVDVEPEIAIHRVLKRYKESGRFVDPQVILEAGLKCRQNFAILNVEGYVHESNTFNSDQEA